MLKRRRTEQDRMLSSQPEPQQLYVPPPKQARRPRPGRVLLLLGIVSAIPIVAYIGMAVLLNAERLHPVLEATLSRTLGRPVRIGTLRFSFGFGRLIATDVTIDDDPAFSSAPFLQARQVEFGVSRIPLIFGQEMAIDSVTIDEPAVTLIHGAGRSWNYYGILEAGPTPPAASAGPRVRVRGGVITIRGGDRGGPLVWRNVALDFAHFSTAADCPFTLAARLAAGGTVKLNGKAGPVRWDHRLPSLPVSVLVNAKQIAIAESNLAGGMAPALDGLLSLDGTVESDGNLMQVKGSARVSKLKLVRQAVPSDQTLLLVFALDHDLSTGTGSLTRCEVQLDKSSGSLTGKYSIVEEKAVVKLTFNAQGVPLMPLAALLPAVSLPLPSGTSLQGGVAFVDLAVQGPVDHPTTTGSIAVKNTQLNHFDLEERLASVSGLDQLHISRNLEIISLNAKINAGAGKLTVDTIDANIPEVGTLSGNGAIGDDQILDFHMNASRTGDKRQIPFSVRGACASPIFRQPGKTL
jgi:AsmA protein